MGARKCDICGGKAIYFGKFAVCDICKDKAIGEAVARSMARKRHNPSDWGQTNSMLRDD